MVRGQHNREPGSAPGSKNKRGSSRSSESASTSTPQTSVQNKPESISSCMTCGTIVSKDTRALQCDGCSNNDAWKCADCLNLSNEMYDQLLLGIDLKWLCANCDGKLPTNVTQDNSTDKLDRITNMLEMLITKSDNIEEILKEKADKVELNALETRVVNLEMESNVTKQAVQEVKHTLEKEINQHKWSAICDKEAETELKINELEQKLSSLADDSKNSKQTVIDYVQKAVEVQAQETKEEELEKEKRKTSIIVHGLPESESDDSTERAEGDSCIVTSMFQVMGCADVKVKNSIRLGKYQAQTQDSSSLKPRPVKVTFETETDKNDALRMSKNLRKTQEGVWHKVFLHQDLTLKEREIRKELLQEMKRRKDTGETDLILVGLKIVKKRHVLVQQRPATDNQ